MRNRFSKTVKRLALVPRLLAFAKQRTVVRLGFALALSVLLASVCSAQNDTVYGAEACPNITYGIDNSCYGYQAGYGTSSGNSNVIVGTQAGYSNNTGGANVFVGTQAGYNNNTGGSNVYVGSYAGRQNRDGSLNVMIGNQAGENLSSNNNQNNIFIGAFAGSGANSGMESYDIYIGPQNTPAGETNATRIGRFSAGPSQTKAAYISGIYGVNVSGIPVQINANGQLGADTSSLRFKEQVRDMGDSTDALMKLRPVTFLYKSEYSDGERTLQYGLIAEEVAKVYPELVAYDKDGQPYAVRYQYLSTMLLNEVQKQYRRAEAQVEVIQTQQEKIEQLEQRLSRLERLAGSQAYSIAQK